MTNSHEYWKRLAKKPPRQEMKRYYEYMERKTRPPDQGMTTPETPTRAADEPPAKGESWYISKEEQQKRYGGVKYAPGHEPPKPKTTAPEQPAIFKPLLEAGEELKKKHERVLMRKSARGPVGQLGHSIAYGIVSTPILAAPATYSLITRPVETLEATYEEFKQKPLRTFGELVGGAIVFGGVGRVVGGLKAPTYRVKAVRGVVEEFKMEPAPKKPSGYIYKPLKEYEPIEFAPKELLKEHELRIPAKAGVRVEKVRPIISEYKTKIPPTEIPKHIEFIRIGEAYALTKIGRPYARGILSVPIEKPMSMSKIIGARKIITRPTKTKPTKIPPPRPPRPPKKLPMPPKSPRLLSKIQRTQIRMRPAPLKAQKLKARFFEDIEYVSPAARQVVKTKPMGLVDLKPIRAPISIERQAQRQRVGLLPRTRADLITRDYVVTKTITTPFFAPITATSTAQARLYRAKTLFGLEQMREVRQAIKPTVSRLLFKRPKPPKRRKPTTGFRPPFQEKGYHPSLAAAFFGIRAKAPPRIVTGFGVRPVIRRSKRRRRRR
jgi:hypothetical protein